MDVHAEPVTWVYEGEPSSVVTVIVAIPGSGVTQILPAATKYVSPGLAGEVSG
jgi:hypothetical protein